MFIADNTLPNIGIFSITLDIVQNKPSQGFATY